MKILHKLTKKVLFETKANNLCEADLCEADLRGADLSGANLLGADTIKWIKYFFNLEEKE